MLDIFTNSGFPFGFALGWILSILFYWFVLRTNDLQTGFMIGYGDCLVDILGLDHEMFNDKDIPPWYGKRWYHSVKEKIPQVTDEFEVVIEDK